MDAASPSSSANSRVIVECTDPSNIFNIFEPALAEHLPLRNLHWKSPNRPLRSIDNLHIALTQADDNRTDSSKTPRRHQIPGLQQTPYIKVYLLRCDDNENYKETARKQIRQWIKTNVAGSESKSSQGSQEDHDAFEWMIVHVVLPDTPAATQPQTHKQLGLGSTDSTDSLTNKSKWPGKGSSTIYEKLRADFNSSSRSAIDRVAQIRIQKTDPKAQPVLSALPGDLKEQWEDLVEKLKVAILSSFHIRVAQYEDDIRERDAQRALPGWNFCTFFILKEGLAQGFENVGLLEDASAVYDELALGLDTVARGQKNQPDQDQDGSLLLFSKGLKNKIRVALDQLQSEPDADDSDARLRLVDTFMEIDPLKFPFNIREKNYRSLILANEVSLLDFQIYLFSRQLELLLRRANVSPKSKQSDEFARASRPKQTSENLVILAEICQRATSFISFASSSMRHDLYSAWGGQEGLGENDLRIQRTVISNIVSSWSWHAILQILSETSVPAIMLPDGPMQPDNSRRNSEQPTKNGSNGEQDHHSVHENQAQNLHEFIATENDDVLFGRPASQQKGVTPRTGMEEIISWRAELIMQARKLLQGLRLEEEPSAAAVTLISKKTHASQVSAEDSGGILEGEESSGTDGEKKGDSRSIAGLDPDVLKNAAISEEIFFGAYESLTNRACRHFLTARKSKSATNALLDLANLEYAFGKTSSAASHFEQATAIGMEESWTTIGLTNAEFYSDCLKRLGRREDYVKSLLTILAFSTVKIPSKLNPIQQLHGPQRHLNELLSMSTVLGNIVNVPLLNFFEISYQRQGILLSEQGGFSFTLSIRLLFDATIELSPGATLTLFSTAESYPSTLVIKTSRPLRVGNTAVDLIFRSNCETSGWYGFQKLELSSVGVFWLHDFEEIRKTKSRKGKIGSTLDWMDRPILLYPGPDSLRVAAHPAPYTNLLRPRKVLVELHSGRENIDECCVRFKAGTAGLRLHLHEAELVDNDMDSDTELDSKGVHGVRLSFLPSSSVTKFTIPCTLDNADTTEFEIKLEVSWTSAKGAIVSYSRISISTILPISVNVHDIFKGSSLYSRFSICPATLVPLRLLGCDLEGGKYLIEHGSKFQEPIDVFPKQPASWVCKFTHRPKEEQALATSPPALEINFESLDEMILSAMESEFVNDIQASECRSLTWLLCPHLLSAYRAKWTEQDLETACLLQEVEVWPFDEIDWPLILKGLNSRLREVTQNWLQKWHDTTATVSLSRSSAPKRCISLPVELPAPRMAITARIDLDQGFTSPFSMMVGEPISARVVLSHAGGWQPPSESEVEEEIELSFEIVASPDVWIIGGSRKGSLLLANEMSTTIPILLLPQRAGHLLLPVVEVRCFTAGDQDRPILERSELSCELDYKSQAKVVFVAAQTRMTTVMLSGQGTGEGVARPGNAEP